MHKDRPDCEFLDYFDERREEYPHFDFLEFCRDCELFEHCKPYSDFLEGDE